MAQTAASTGSTLIAGFRTHTNDWNASNTGAALTLTDALPMRLEGAPKMVPKYADNKEFFGGVGLPRMGLSVATYETVGAIKCNGWFRSALSRMFALFFGTETTAAAGGGMYTHLFTWAANSQYVGTFAYVENLLCHDFPMTKITSLEFDFEPGQIPVVTVGLFCKREYTDGSGANTFGGMTTTTVTFPAQPAVRYPIFAASTCTLRFDDASSVALASTADDKFPTKLNIKFARKVPMIHSLRNAPYPDEPIYSDGDLECSATITFPYLATAAEWSRLAAATETKLDVALTGSAFGGVNYKWLFEFPCAVPKGDGLPTPNKNGLLGYDLALNCYDALDNPSGMAFSLPRFTVTDLVSGNHITNG